MSDNPFLPKPETRESVVGRHCLKLLRELRQAEMQNPVNADMFKFVVTKEIYAEIIVQLGIRAVEMIEQQRPATYIDTELTQIEADLRVKLGAVASTIVNPTI